VTYQAIYYRDSGGREPVNEAIDQLDEPCQDSVDWCINLLNCLSDGNPELPFPHSSAVRNPRYRAFRELRADCGRRHNRIIYRRSGRFFVLLHLIAGKTSSIADEDLRIAADRWTDFQARMNSIPRGSPRAMGHDAP
jgi:hypothetical protein